MRKDLILSLFLFGTLLLIPIKVNAGTYDPGFTEYGFYHASSIYSNGNVNTIVLGHEDYYYSFGYTTLLQPNTMEFYAQNMIDLSNIDKISFVVAMSRDVPGSVTLLSGQVVCKTMSTAVVSPSIQGYIDESHQDNREPLGYSFATVLCDTSNINANVYLMASIRGNVTDGEGTFFYISKNWNTYEKGTSNNDIASAIQNQTKDITDSINGTNNKLDEINNSDISDADKQMPDDSSYQDYSSTQNDLLDKTKDVDLNVLDVGLDVKSSSWVWDTLTRLIQSNSVVFGLFIGILSIGIIKLVLGR